MPSGSRAPISFLVGQRHQRVGALDRAAMLDFGEAVD